MILRKFKKFLFIWTIGMLMVIIGAFFVFLDSSYNLFECLASKNLRVKSKAEEIYCKLSKRQCQEVQLTSRASSAKIVEGSPQLGSDGPYLVLYDAYEASNFYENNNSVTYTTHTTTEYINHVSDIAMKWDGPISVAVFAPSFDYCSVITQILSLRSCGHPSVKQKVTWHLYWPKLFPPYINWKLKPKDDNVSCEGSPKPFLNNPRVQNLQEGIGYPINVGRNVARQSAKTWFVIASDIELHPSKNLSQQFIAFIKEVTTRKNSKLWQFWPRVYVTPAFEVKYTIPNTKEELLKQIKKGEAVNFHRYVCPHCQKIPGMNKWLQTLGKKDQISAFSAVCRHYPYHRWEPIYISTKNEPLYDERLTWEGLQDKMSQMHELCLKKYNFVILDRAFVVHSPGIKYHTQQVAKNEAFRAPFINDNMKTYNIIMSELEQKYGSNNKCRKH